VARLRGRYLAYGLDEVEASDTFEAIVLDAVSGTRFTLAVENLVGSTLESVDFKRRTGAMVAGLYVSSSASGADATGRIVVCLVKDCDPPSSHVVAEGQEIDPSSAYIDGNRACWKRTGPDGAPATECAPLPSD
jgi:hypothetical protein